MNHRRNYWLTAFADVLLLSAGSAGILLTSAFYLGSSDFNLVAVSMTGQAVVNLVLRAGYSEPSMFVDQSATGRRLLAQGVAIATIAGVVLGAQLLLSSVNLWPWSMMMATWTIAYFALDFARCSSAPADEGLPRFTISASLVAVFGVVVLCAMAGADPFITNAIWMTAAFVTVLTGIFFGRRGTAPGCYSVRLRGDVPLPELRRRFVVDAIMLQANVQLAAWIAGNFGYEGFAGLLRVSQLVFLPVTLGTLAVQTRTLQSLIRSARSANFPLRTVLLGWLPIAGIAIAPVFLLVPVVEEGFTNLFPTNITGVTSVLLWLVLLKIADVGTNWGVTVLRGIGAHKTSSILRRTWGVGSATIVLTTTPWADVAFTFAALASFSICVSIATVAASTRLWARRFDNPN